MTKIGHVKMNPCTLKFTLLGAVCLPGSCTGGHTVMSTTCAFPTKTELKRLL